MIEPRETPHNSRTLGRPDSGVKELRFPTIAKIEIFNMKKFPNEAGYRSIRTCSFLKAWKIPEDPSLPACVGVPALVYVVPSSRACARMSVHICTQSFASVPLILMSGNMQRGHMPTLPPFLQTSHACLSISIASCLTSMKCWWDPFLSHFVGILTFCDHLCKEALSSSSTKHIKSHVTTFRNIVKQWFFQQRVEHRIVNPQTPTPHTYTKG